MNTNDANWSADERERLTQELLELHFGCHDDPAALAARLAAEPALRALQAEVLAQAALLEAAVRPEQPRLELPAPGATPARWRRLRSPVWRLGTACAAAAAVLLGCFAYGQFKASQLARLEREHLHLTVSAPKAVPAGAPWGFTVEARDLRGAATDCRVRWQAFGAGDTVLAAGESPLIGGTATVAMPARLDVAQRVEVIASHATDEVRQVFELSTAAAGPLVHVSTDRPVYRPGEPVYVRAVVLDRVTRLPLAHAPQMTASLFDAKDAPVGSDYDLAAPTGVGSFLLHVPAESAGGPHTVRVAANDGSFAPQAVDVVVRAFRNPQLDKRIVLDRVSYAPGARGSAEVTVRRLGDDGAASGAMARGALIVDGEEVWHEERGLGATGRATFAFVVPKDVAKGAARFVATITDGGVVETEVEPFVVPTGVVRVAVFPEGGELVAGVENGVYLECTDPLGRPVDTAGELLDGRDRRVASFRTAHQGRAKLAFVPAANERYRIRLAGKPETTELPAAQANGIALRLAGDDIAAGAPLRLAVDGRGNGPWLVAAFCRGVLVGQSTLRADDTGELRADAAIPLAASASGVLRVTVFDRQLQPVAERLVRRRAAERVDIALSPLHATVAPGDSQTIGVRTTDEAGRAVRAVVGVAVSDAAALSLGSEPQVGLVDDAMLFADVPVDVERLEDLGDFFVANDASARNVDLVLGTRGWRRFVWKNDDAAKAAIAAKGDAAENVLAREGFSQTPQVLSNLQAARAPAAPLAHAANAAQRLLRDAAALALIVLLILSLAESIAWLLRKATHAPPVLQGFVGAIAGTGALLAFAALFAHGVRSDALAPGAAFAVRSAPDFDGDPEAGLVMLSAAAPIRDAAGPFVEMKEESAFDSNAWNSAVGLGGGAGGRFGGRRRLDDRAAEVMDLFEEVVQGDTGDTPVLAHDSFADTTLSLLVLQQGAGGGGEGYVPYDARASFARYRTHWRERQYAHRHTPSDERRDFTPTIYWNTLLVTGADGNATATFATSDAVTTWRVRADAHAPQGPTGRLGQAQVTFTTELPLQVEPKLPDEVSAGDRLQIPVAAIVVDANVAEVALQVRVGQGLRLGAGAPAAIALERGADGTGRGRVLLPVDVDTTVGTASIEIDARAGRFVDRVRHTLTIAPRGFPHRRSGGGSITATSPGEWRLVVPAESVPDSGHVALKVYPSPIAALTEGLEGILQEPHGCFEQASSSNYPNTMVLSLIEANGDDVPAIASRARSLLPAGYAKITGYECTKKGYEWFGHDPGHEALTAYGLLQFHDMARVFDVDADMVARTRQWLLARRDGKGNYPHDGQDHHSFGGRSVPVTNAYVTYALLVAGTDPQELKVELDALVARTAIDDPYELALIACAVRLGQRPEAAAARQRLATLQADDGSLPGAKSTITMSGGRDAIVEATGFAVLAWLADPQFHGNVRRAIEYLTSARSARGTFGATQATIVALNALTAYAAQHRTMRQDGTLRIHDGERLLAERAFAANDTGAIEFDLWRELAPGEHTLVLSVEGGGDSPLPWAGDVTYHAEQPADDPDTATTITTRLRQDTVVEGRTVALDVTVANRTDRELPTPIAIVGLPAGLELPTKVLEDLQAQGAFAFWELLGRELVLYWRKLDPGQQCALTLDLTARVPGTSTGPASRTYLYYTPEQKRWAEPLRIAVTAR